MFVLQISLTSNVLTQCRGPAPPIGVHRYVFLLYKQPEKIKFEGPDPDHRFHFKVAAEAEKYNLGEPEAVIYFSSTK